jgi:hypothetical protein
MYKKKLSRQQLWARSSSDARKPRTRLRKKLGLGIGALLVIWCLTGGARQVLADCFDQCQATLAGCAATANGDPGLEFKCQRDYDDCSEACILH